MNGKVTGTYIGNWHQVGLVQGLHPPDDESNPRPQEQLGTSHVEPVPSYEL